jgi:hypothetical protein
MMNTCLLETCRGLKEAYYIEESCVKLVTYQKLYRDERAAKYKKKKKKKEDLLALKIYIVVLCHMTACKVPKNGGSVFF